MDAQPMTPEAPPEVQEFDAGDIQRRMAEFMRAFKERSQKALAPLLQMKALPPQAKLKRISEITGQCLQEEIAQNTDRFIAGMFYGVHFCKPPERQEEGGLG